MAHRKATKPRSDARQAGLAGATKEKKEGKTPAKKVKPVKAKKALKTSVLALLVSAMTLAQTACVVRTKDNGKFFFGFGTRIELGHESAATQAEAESEIKSQPLLDYLAKTEAKDDAAEENPTP
ncbi:MAG: hypothetical protein J5J06_05520 [Phycisphaerae bacterium]|nr:hypothetical protein [Phycisphaerae bacterium]